MLRDVDWAKAANYIAFGIIGIGFLALYLGWNGTANVDCVACQIPYLLSSGAVGLGLIGVGIAVVVVQNGKRNRVQLEARMTQLQEALERVATAGPAQVRTRSGGSKAGSVIAGASSYHSPDCHLVQGRDEAEVLTMDEAEEQGLSPCRICNP